VIESVAVEEGESSFEYGFEMFRLARMEMRAGEMARAADDLAKAIKMLDPQVPITHPIRAQFQRVLALIAQARGDLAAARKELESGQDLLLSTPSFDPVSLAELRSDLAGVLIGLGDLKAARVAIDAALPELEKGLLSEAPVLREARARQQELAQREAAPAAAKRL
jgi:tetratricopeptide (TPR) repeat protein